MRQFEKFVCVACRRSFKRPPGRGAMHRPCPLCGKPAIEVGQKFKPPRASDDEQWEKVRLLISHGFRFHSHYVESASGHWSVVPYPKTLREARVWVKKWAHKPQEHALSGTGLIVKARAKKRAR